MGVALEMLEGVCGHRRGSLQYLTFPGLEYQGTAGGGNWRTLQPELHLHREQTKACLILQAWEEEDGKLYRDGWGWWDRLV